MQILFQWNDIKGTEGSPPTNKMAGDIWQSTFTRMHSSLLLLVIMKVPVYVLFSSKYLLRVQKFQATPTTVPQSFSHGVHLNFEWPVDWLSSSCLLPRRTTQRAFYWEKCGKPRKQKAWWVDVNIFCFKLTYSAS